MPCACALRPTLMILLYEFDVAFPDYEMNLISIGNSNDLRQFDESPEKLLEFLAILVEFHDFRHLSQDY